MASNKSAAVAKNGTINNNTNNNNNNNTKSNGSNAGTTKDEKPQKQIKVKKPKTRDSDCCSINFIKYVLIIVDVIFFVSIFIHSLKLEKLKLSIRASQKHKNLQIALELPSEPLNVD